MVVEMSVEEWSEGLTAILIARSDAEAARKDSLKMAADYPESREYWELDAARIEGSINTLNTLMSNVKGARMSLRRNK
jgi:hypothetical protein